MDSMQGRVRDRRATYEQSLAVLQTAKACGVYTKSSIMLGLGEKKEEVEDCMLDLFDCGVDIVTLGQYLQPTPQQLGVVEYVTPSSFDEWKRFGEDVVGFRRAFLPHSVAQVSS
jgi:lipoyl synthase